MDHHLLLRELIENKGYKKGCPKSTCTFRTVFVFLRYCAQQMISVNAMLAKAFWGLNVSPFFQCQFSRHLKR